ncbi:bbd831c8-eca6-4706-a2cd-64588a809f31 [Sclerotinia trifoliorum]|uniref:Bbd831c8-eca6-4706-a2cd-64588a809f31 n=1 Tax=Sclerotinia trifoliorum TaxID=28548 RepID=A0A8H2VUC5_9HELO|nr:bbd831c8-eca6-4706-a2cd-64588a809f31 [Sclerotinia trifoliorum]
MGNGVIKKRTGNGLIDEQSSLLGDRRSRDRVDGGDDDVSTGQSGGEDDISNDDDIEDKANQQVGKWRAILISISVFGLIFLQATNMSGISTTQSKIAEDLDSFTEASWFTSTYLIAMSSISPVAARLAQIFSPRDLILAAAILFSIGGTVTSQAPDLKTFLVGRAISGIGGAGIMTISLILILELTSKKRRGIFIGLANSGFTLGVSLGAVVWGALLPVVGWRALFLFQSPLAVLSGIGIYFSIPKSFTSGHKTADGESITSKLAKIDYLGSLFLITTIILFLYGLSSPKIEWLPILFSILTLILFLYIELKISTDPIIPISVLKSRGALLSCISQLGIMSARWSILFYAPVYAISLRGWSPASAGSILIPTNVGFALGGIIAGAFHIKRAGSFWLPCITSLTLFSTTLILFSQFSRPSTPIPIFILLALTNGLCIGAAVNYTLAHLLHLTHPSTHFISTSLITTFRGFAGSFGSAIGGGAFIRVLKTGLEDRFMRNGGLEGREDLVRKLLGSPALVGTLSGVERDVAMRAYADGFRALWGGAAVVAF